MKKPTYQPEKVVEAYLRKRVKQIGGKCIKMVPTYENGIPDRQVLYKGLTVFVELKKEKENPRPLQVAYMNELEAQGFQTRIIRTKEEVEQLITFLVNAQGI